MAPMARRAQRLLLPLALLLGCAWQLALRGPSFGLAAGTPVGPAFINSAGKDSDDDDDDDDESSAAGPSIDPTMIGTGLLLLLGVHAYGGAWMKASKMKAEEASEAEPAAAEAKKKPRIDAFDSLRFFLIFYIATGHFVMTATSNQLLLKLTTQINVVVGAFFVLSGYVAAYTTTELGQRKGSKRLDNAAEFAISRIMGFWWLHFAVLLLFAPMFFWVDATYSGVITASWHGFLSLFLLQAWFPGSAEIWNAPTWFLSAFAFCLCVLPYALRALAPMKKAQLRTSLAALTVFSIVAKVGYSYDLNLWDAMEGTLSARTHPNYFLFNAIRFSPFSAALEVLMGAAACRLVMLDKDGDAAKSASPTGPLVFMLGLLVARATGFVAINDMLARSIFFIPHWVVFLMRIHRSTVAPGGPGMLPKALCQPALKFLGGISFPIFIAHGPIGQVFYKKAVATALFGSTFANPHPAGFDWFFGVWWAIVLVTSYALQKLVVESKAVKAASDALSAALLKTLSC